MRNDVRESLYEHLVREATRTRTEPERKSINLSINLALTCDVQQSYLWKHCARYGLARSSFNILALLRYAHPGGLQLSEIGDLLITSRANITGLVDHLEQKGYVRRVVDAHDRRARVAKLTKKGESLLDEAMPGHTERIVNMFSGLSPDEIDQLTELLKKVRHSPVFAQNSDSLGDNLAPAYLDED